MGLLIASTVRLAPQGLLSFRYTDGLARRISTRDDWEADKNKVAAGMNPAAIAAQVTVLLPSIVPGGFDVMSKTTRFTPLTSLTIRLLILATTSYGTPAQSAVMASSLVTTRTATTLA